LWKEVATKWQLKGMVEANQARGGVVINEELSGKEMECSSFTR